MNRKTAFIAILSASLAVGAITHTVVQAQETTASTVATADDDRDMDWGWLGLLGLIGLAGLRRRDDHRTHNSTGNTGYGAR